jgi:hypothetical protein
VSRFSRLAAYGVVLAFSFGGGVLAGAAAGPDPTPTPQSHQMDQAETHPAATSADGTIHESEHSHGN